MAPRLLPKVPMDDQLVSLPMEHSLSSQPKRSAEAQILKPLHTPTSPLCSSSTSSTSALPLPPQCSAPAFDALPTATATTKGDGIVWPSQLYQQSSILPPQTDEPSAIALLFVLRTEIKSHSATREMLHATEQRRREAIQSCHQWAAAYNGLGGVICGISQENSRLSAENAALRAQTQSESTTDVQLNAAAPKIRQIEVLRKKLFRPGVAAAGQGPEDILIEGLDLDSSAESIFVTGNEADVSPSYSPEM